MKKLIHYFILCICLFLSNQLFSQTIDYNIRYNTSTQHYEVYAKADFTDPAYFVGGGTQVSIVVPADIDDTNFIIKANMGGPWGDNTRVFAPAADTTHDFHSITTDGIMMAYFTAGQDALLFTFQLPLKNCVEGIRIFENSSDPMDVDAGMYGADFKNYFANAFTLSDDYNANYNNTGTQCSDPILVTNPLTIPQDSSGIVCMNVVDANPQDSFTVMTCGAANGTAMASITGSLACVTYTPNAGYNGTDAVCVIVCDQSGNCDTTNVPITIVPPPLVTTLPEPPIVYTSPISTPQDRTVDICMPVLDPNVGDSFTPTLCGVPDGSATPSIVDGDLCLSFTPNSGFLGDTKVCVIVCDQTGLCDTVDIPVTVYPLPLDEDSLQVPIVSFPPVITPEDSIINTCGPIADANLGDTYTASICNTPANVAATASIDNVNNQVCVSITPNTDFNGHAEICLVVCDQNNLCDTVSIPVTVTPVNDTPIAVDDTQTTDEDIAIVIDVQINDKDIDGDTLFTTLITSSLPSNGTATVINQDSIHYLSDANFYGNDTLAYQICDNGTPQLCDTAQIIIIINPINDAPVADTDSIVTEEEVMVNIMVQTNDIDIDMDDITTTIIMQPINGTASVVAMDSIDYTPAVNYTGLDSLTYEICDNGLAPQLCDTTTVIITMTPINDKPVAENDTFQVTMNIANNIFPIENNDSDIEDSLLVATAINPTSNQGGTITTQDDTLLVYTPAFNFYGIDTFRYQICDGDTPELCDTATVIVTVVPDHDGDGIADEVDVDDDNDGIPDAIEGYTDADGDGIPNNLDLDADNDGIQDVLEAGGADANGDGRIDIVGVNLDSADLDNDGLMDIVDAGTGIGDTLSNLTNGSIYTNFPTNAIDTDGDGLPDYLDVDADNDGITDLIEAGGVDTDGDGRIDTPIDNDKDGWADIYDADQDNDLTNSQDNPQNADASTGPLMVTDADANNDGTPGTAGNGGFNGGDFDGDLVPDFRDLDSDNDGLPDLIEVGGTDIEGDGIVDDFVDADNDGYDDNYDTDDDGAPGRDDPVTEPLVTTDPDGTGADEDGRPIDDDNDGTAIKGITADIDSDGNPDYKDLDADNDGIPDLIEMGGTDINGDGVIDDFIDVDGDGFDDRYDPFHNNKAPDENQLGSPLITTDPEGTTDDGRPEDVDNDGTAYNGETADFDKDGLPDSEDLDTDNDGLPDLIEMGGTDINGDGVIDDFVDADGDGFDDTYDGDDNTTPTANDGGDPLVTTDPEGTTDDGRPEDNDNDGTPYNGDTADVDQDGTPDNEDLDADNDGIPDLIEIGGVDTDNNGVVDNFTDADGDGFDDAKDPTQGGTPEITTDPEGTTDDGRPEDDDNNGTPYDSNAVDADMDGILDSEDLDSDDDGIADIVENGQGNLDTDNDGTIDPDDANYADTDGDGIADPVDEAPSIYGDDQPILVDTDQDGNPDLTDIDSDGDGIPDVNEIGLGNLDTDDDGRIDEPDTDNDGITDTADNNDDDADDQDFGGASAPTTNDHLVRSIRLACVNPLTEEVTIKNFGTVTWDISAYRLCSKITYTTDLTSQTLVNGSFILAPDASVTVKLTQISLDDVAADLGLYLNGTTNFADSLSMQDFIQWGTGGQGRENVAVAKGIWEAGTYISPNELPEYCYVGDGTVDGAVEWKGHLIAPLTDEGETQAICADTTWTINHPITATNCNGTLTGTATGAGGTYSINPTTGCIDYTAPIDPIVLVDSVCIVICDAANVCDTSYAIFPIDTIDIQYPTFPLDPSETATVCVDTSWQLRSPMNATDCNGNAGNTTAIGGVYTIDPLTNCVTYTAPANFVAHYDTVCVITCDGFNICDTSIVVFPIDSTDIVFPPNSIDPTDMPTVCVDTSWISGSPLTATDCNGQTSGIALPNGGVYTVDPVTGCVDYTFPTSPLLTLHDTVCVVLCDVNNVCDTSIIVFPLDTIDVAMPIIPVIPGDTSMVCVEMDWVTAQPIVATDCDGQPVGMAAGIMGDYTIDTTTGCITYIAPPSMIDVPGDTICIILCDANAVCDTSTVIFLFDMDGDLVADIYDYDDDNDGIPDAIEGMVDTDGDGIYDLWDLDSDNDGIQDVLEAGGVDNNGDGRLDINGTNWDAADLDNDGLLDVIDVGSGPNDTLSNLTNGTIYTKFPTTAIDTDGDGISDFRDVDADNDGITDIIEAGGADENGDGRVDVFADSDADGWSNYYDGDNDVLLINGIDNPQDLINGTGPLMTTDPDTNGDGTPGAAGNGNFTGGNFDADIVADFRDLDSDNDGTPDIIEVGGTDQNGDGKVDEFNDADGDGYDDNYDTDDDGVVGVEDPLTEPLVTTDPDGTGTDEDGRPTDSNNDGTIYNGQTVDIDRDGHPDHLDLDADNDGIPDLIEVGGTDEDGNGIIDNFNDADGDGFDDSLKLGAVNRPYITTDTEGSTDDGRPEDDDNDGTAYNGDSADVDSDGIPDSEDLDADNDGIPDLIEVGGTDEDGNGIIDDFNDADGDGFDDTYSPENGGTPLIYTDPEGSFDDGRPEDDDNDGTAYNGDSADVDSDGIPDSEDVDADNDGLPDLIEVGGTDIDGDGRIDDFEDIDEDGFDDSYDPFHNFKAPDENQLGTPLVSTDPEGTTDDGRPEDTDGNGTTFRGDQPDNDMDGVLDSEDLDSDNDGLPDLIEVGGIDTNGDGRIDHLSDTDGDGMDNDYDPTNGGNPLVFTDPEGTTDDGRPEDADNDGTVYNGETADIDSDGIPDFEDLDTDNDGIPDLIEMGGTDEDGNGIIDNFNDTDGDGFDDTYSPETGGTPLISTDPEGTTNDGRPEDDDNDGTAINGPTADADSDGIMDSEDLDADNDGIPDLIEVGGTDVDGDGIIDDFNDANGDGFDDTYSPAVNGLPLITTDPEGTTNDGRPEDDDNDGTPYNGQSVDVDKDGVPDNEDLDSDNDAIPDYVEVGGADIDGNGIVDNFVDVDGDGFADSIDPDNNNTPTDENEMSGVMISTDDEGETADGRPEDMDNDGTTYEGKQADTDKDGAANSEDLDADNDSVPDIVESGNEAFDTNDNGVLDPDDEGYQDTDQDGVVNLVDEQPFFFGELNGPIQDIDQDGEPNFIDLEADGDGINDIDEANNSPLDQNGDGVIDDPSDMDNDGIADILDNDDDDPDNDDLGGISNPIDDDWEQAGAPEIIDPCNCLANESGLNAGDGQFSEEVVITSTPGETWRITAVTGFYQNPSAPVFPPASGVSGPYPQVLYTVGTVLTETPIGGGRSTYTLQGIHVDAIGYNLMASNGSQTLAIGHTCTYDNSCRSIINTDPDGTPGVPVPDQTAQNYIIPTDNVPRRDTMKSCEADKNLFIDDGMVDGLYQDTAARNNVLTICPTTQWQTILVTFTQFDLADGDVLNVYEGTGTNIANQIANMTGTGVSQANGGWVAAHCDPDTNATGCLTFQFRTNGDLNKGRGWSANVTCNDRGIQLTPPNNLVATLACEQPYTIFDIKPATINSNCGAAVQDSQIVRVFNTLGELCLDTCLAATDVVKDTFGLGSYRVEYKLKSDTTKTTQGIMSVQGASLVCNDKVNVPLGSSCAIFLTPDDLLESTCDTIIDTVYYFITLKGLDKNGNEVVLATGGGKGGNYPMVTKDMIDQCGGTITATIEKRFYEGLNLSFCNNGPQNTSCSVAVNLLDQSPPTFISATTKDTFRLCSADLTAETLGIPAPKAIDNCDSVKVEFMGATVLNEGGPCDTTRALLNWSATDACGNVATLAQSVVILRPDVADIVQAPDMILSCGEDAETALNDFAKTGMPRIKVGKVVNGVLVPTDTIALDTANYVCGYILQKREVRVPADCGIKVFRYWDVLDWCDTEDGIVPIDTQYIELRDTLAPKFVATELPTTNLELAHDACTLDITKLAAPTATDNCSTPSVTMAKVFRLEAGTKWEIPTAELTELNADSFEVLWIAADDCHVQTKTASLTQLVIIEDNTKPTAICTDKINLSLGRSEGNLHYREFDAGSNDACGIAKYEVSKDEINWDSTVVFTCEEAHTAVKVYLRVTDVNGNQNTCWTLVNVEDKIAPICSDLPTMTGNCEEGHGNGLAATDVNDNSEMDDNEWVDMTDEQANEFNTKYGNPNCSDNVTCHELVIQQQYQLIKKVCGIATIKRRYRAIDWDGQGMTSGWAEQVINIESKADWSITLPADWKGKCGEAVPTSELVITNGACDLMAYEVEEKVFTTTEDACLKVVRTFTIINWCNYQAGDDGEVISRIENEHGMVTEGATITSEGFEKTGKLTYIQILKLKDETAPIITVEATDDCIESTDCQAPKRFAISATDCNEAATTTLTYSWTISAGDTELGKGEGNDFDYPVATGIEYEVVWKVADNCGNTAKETADYQFTDCKKPAPYCLNGVAVELMPDAGMIQIWATDLDAGSSDNCTSTDKLQLKIWHESLGDEPAHIANVLALPENITFDCAYLGNQVVNVYVIDEANNWDFCVTYINVQDNMGACQNTEAEGMAIVSGTIKDWRNQTVEEVAVNVSNSSSMMTQTDGHYDFELAMNNGYTIEPAKDMHPLNGVSTFDLVLISKHILGITEMDNPYQLIAADVNGSGTITAFDMVQIRQLILNITTEFSNSPSWKFVYAGYEFTTDHPMSEAYPQIATVADLQQDMEIDFVAIKMGDVNGNARPSSLVQATDRTTTNAFEITTEDSVLKAGKTYTVTFNTDQLSTIQGYQFTLGYDNLKVEKLKSGVVGVENFGLHKMDKGMITMSWNQSAVSSTQLTTSNRQPTTLFSIEFTAEKDGKLSEQLNILNRPTAIEAYDENGDLMEVQLTFTTPLYNDQFQLFQNQPNPFHDKTTIGFHIHGDSEVQLVLRDETGRVLKTVKEDRKAGYNTFEFNKEELTNGFIYYQLSTKFGTKAKKMLRLN